MASAKLLVKRSLGQKVSTGLVGLAVQERGPEILSELCTKGLDSLKVSTLRICKVIC